MAVIMGLGLLFYLLLGLRQGLGFSMLQFGPHLLGFTAGV